MFWGLLIRECLDFCSNLLIFVCKEVIDWFSCLIFVLMFLVINGWFLMGVVCKKVLFIVMFLVNGMFCFKWGRLGLMLILMIDLLSRMRLFDVVIFVMIIVMVCKVFNFLLLYNLVVLFCIIKMFKIWLFLRIGIFKNE